MQILVDTPIWSLALRRRTSGLNAEARQLTAELSNLVEEGRAQLIGLVRQELLSGIRHALQYDRLREHLRGFPDEPLETADFEHAARLSNQCRTSGVAGSIVDFLICAVALRRSWPIFTMDQDFLKYAEVLPIVLHHPRK